MNVKILASIKPDYEMSLEELKNAKITLQASQALPPSDGYQSVLNHCVFNLLIEDIPKIVVMILNNEKFGDSAGCTQVKPDNEEKRLYDKWFKIFKQRIPHIYPDLNKIKADSLAHENASYLISVFAPVTVEYIANIRQINNIISTFEDFIDNDDDTDDFFNMLRQSMIEFVEEMEQFYVPSLHDDSKQRKISLFDTRFMRNEHLGETYSISYPGSFAQLAEIQGHYNLDYKMKAFDDPWYFLPSILEKDVNLKREWKADIRSIADIYPQGMMVSIRERGTYENFILKVKEYLCSNIQLETLHQTKKSLKDYLLRTSDVTVSEALNNYDSDSMYDDCSCLNHFWAFSESQY